MKSLVLRLIFVTVIAVLVWTLAESQTLRSAPFTADLEIQPGSVNRVLRLANTETFDGRIELRVSGSGSGLEELTRTLRDPITLQLGVDISFEPGEQLVDLRAVLRASDLFRKNAVTLNDVEPQFIRILTDELVSIDVPVRAELPGIQIEGQARTDPETVQFRIPRSLQSSLASSDVFVYATLGQDELARLTPGVEQRVDGVTASPSPALAASWFLRPTTASVSVILKLKSRTATETIPAVPVQLRVAPAELARFDIEVAEDDRFLHDVVLRGPGPLIERIRADTSLRPVAVVALTFEELERGIETKDAQIILPPGFEQVEAQADSVSVRVTITRREPPPEAD